jgi:hypothetical protein
MSKSRLLLAAVITAVAAGCAVVPAAVTPTSNGSTSNSGSTNGAESSNKPAITVTEGGTIVSKDEPITLTKDTAKKYGVKADLAATAFPYDMRYVSQVPPVKVGNDTVQANDLLICKCGSAAYIGYNIAGDKFGGAIQIIGTTDKSKPTVLREIKLPSMDVNTLYLDGDWLYFGGQADPDVWGFKSYMGRLNTANPSGTDIAKSFIAMPSHAVTSIAKYNNQFYVGAGARDGGVQVLDANLAKVSFKALPDVRSVDFSSKGVIALAGTTDNQAHNGSLVTLSDAAATIGLPDFESDYAKGTLEIDSLGYAHLGLSKSGYQVYNPASKSLLFSLPNPSTNALEATNGVSTDGNLAFVANGEYGFRVVQILDRTQKNEKFGGLAGYHQLKGAAYDGKSYSANFLRFKNDYLFVASGLGGVNIYNVVKK